MLELGVPSLFTLGAVRWEDAGSFKTGLLGLTLQHPPIHMRAEPLAHLQLRGARADLASRYATTFCRSHPGAPGAEVEIELAIPAFVGLGSDEMMALAVARCLAAVNGLPLAQAEELAQAVALPASASLAVHAFQRGGLLLVPMAEATTAESPPTYAPLLRRLVIQHPEREAWAFVFVFPRIPAGTPATLEADRLDDLLAAAPLLPAESGHLVFNDLPGAVERNQFPAFAAILRQLGQMNQKAQEDAGTFLPLLPAEEKVLSLMEESGAVFFGRAPTGLGLFALVHGAEPSIALRTRLRHELGPYGGIIMASITDNRGAHLVERPYGLHDQDLPPVRPRTPG